MEIAAFSQHKGEHVFKSTQEEIQVKHLKSQYGKLERKIDQLTERIKDMGANNTPSQSTYRDSRTCYYCGKEDVKMKCDGMVTLPIDKIGNQEFVVAPQIKSDMILRSDFLTKFDIEINYQKAVIKTPRKTFPITYIDLEVTPPISQICEKTKVASFLQNITKHRAFRDTLGFCQVGKPVSINAPKTYNVGDIQGEVGDRQEVETYTNH
ncbi:hypothetical protein CAPTEDRAFT_196786 [Capitella teleta]|uniref:Uncharacterized protein n=1 Tax=Capitella teleta TaxID=283909 RepID=R7TFF1_CAPTE|nr:hypothetical protein CAPTEDRAFT_196786 [Capitella teleta]|eukprot:ELT92474.1 hypothetical protein CAPTEDRAFT_196786 [Capitella teleta]